MRDLEARLAAADAIIFDCDGTLVDTPPAYARAWAAGLHPAGTALPMDWYLQRAGLSEHLLLDAYEQETGLTMDRPAVVATMRAAFLNGIDDLQEIGAVAAIARAYQGRLKLAVASGGSRAAVTATLDATGLLALFDTVVALDDVQHAKPAPDLFFEAARRLNVAPARCLVFEDSPQGLQAAAAAGMAAIDVADLLPARVP